MILTGKYTKAEQTKKKMIHTKQSKERKGKKE